jgi:integrator complex subunit 3
MLCVKMGRDFLRLLQMISNLSEIKTLLLLITTNPASLDPTFLGISQFWNTVTPREFVTSRLTPDMEFKIIFLLNHVPRQLHYTYLERFRQRFISHGSESVVPDLIRYICTVVHPGNAVLRSTTVQRWQLIRSLFSILSVIKVEVVLQLYPAFKNSVIF